MKGILVTGMSRSGTTWIGRMLTSGSELAYLHEPTNIDCAWHAWNVGLPHQFMYLDDTNAAPYRARFERVVALRPVWSSLIRSRGNPILVRKTLRQAALLEDARAAGKRPVLKDPIAVFASDWLARELDLAVVVAVRHPAAVANSRRALGWRFDFGHLLRQPTLLGHMPATLRDEVEQLAANPSRDIIDESAMLWKLVYWFVQERLLVTEDHIVVKHEELCRNPTGRFESLFEHLGLSYGRSEAKTVVKHSTTRSTFPPPRTDTRRNSADQVGRWREELSATEIQRVRARVGDVANLFYSRDEW